MSGDDIERLYEAASAFVAGIALTLGLVALAYENVVFSIILFVAWAVLIWSSYRTLPTDTNQGGSQ